MIIALRMRLGDHYDVRLYQTTHTTGGAIIGTNPSNSLGAAAEFAADTRADIAAVDR